jgi:acetyltransferase-like isoleucine patch superfamily enzyme
VIGGLKSRLRHWLALRMALMVRSVENEVDALTLPRFANTPGNLIFQSPRRITNPGDITIGDDVSLGPGCMLLATRRYPGRFMRGRMGVEPVEYEPSIRIGDRVSATGHLTIGAVRSVLIDDDVLMASHIFISDNMHGTSRVDIPYKYQSLDRIAPVRIGRGCWIGEHVVILPGVSIGEQSVIGANSVVTQSVPPRCVVAGAPARILRSWDERERAWALCD